MSLKQYCQCGTLMVFNPRAGHKVCPDCQRPGRRAQRPTAQRPATQRPRAQQPPAPKLDRSRLKVARLPGFRPAAKETSAPDATDERRNVHEGEQPKLPMQPGKQSNRSPVREEVVQHSTIQRLTELGARVFQQSVRMKRIFVHCQGCGREWFQEPNYATGQTPGIPDLAFFRETWKHPLLPSTFWQGLEMKGIDSRGARGQLQPAQRELYEAGHITVAETIEKSEAVLDQVDRFFDYLHNLERLARLSIRVFLDGRKEEQSEFENQLREMRPLLEKISGNDLTTGI